jgi:RIO kinase 1
MDEERNYRQLESRAGLLNVRDKDSDDRRTLDEVFDHKTLLTIYDLMSSGAFDTLDFPITTGKEGNVFVATKKGGRRLAVKIYRTSNSTFNVIQRYILGDPRFRGLHGNRWKIIYAWAQKEFKNLSRMRDGRVRCPEPFACRRNVLVMEYIGTARVPAPMLKDAPPRDPGKFLDDLLEQLRRMYVDARLVHCDLSEYNVLVRRGRGVLIDVGQATTSDHPNAGEMLERDVANILRYFRKLGVERELRDCLALVRGG